MSFMLVRGGVVGLVALGLCAAGGNAAPPEVNRAAAADVAAWGHHGTVTLKAMTVAGLVQDASGRVIAVGAGSRAGGGHGIVVALRRDGTADPRFGEGGFYLSSSQSTIGWKYAAALPDGGLVVAGSSRWGDVDSESLFALAELDSHGKLVRTFATNGMYVATNASCLRGVSGLALQGKEILVIAARELQVQGSDHVRPDAI